MKLLIVGVVHYAQYSSIVRKRGNYYSKRLENLLWSINWVEETAVEQGADKIIYLGDFFDRADLNAEELTAFRDIIWTKNIPHTFIVGNHETASHTLVYLPYIFENDRKPIQDYLDYLCVNKDKPYYIFSHNDIKGVQYGLFESKSGFDRDEILNTNCKYFINGHIHNKGWAVPGRILNLGNITGQNFNEDGYKYPHEVLILDTDTQELNFIRNPYAFNFIKLEIYNEEGIENIKILPHTILSIKCVERLINKLKEHLDQCEDVEEYKIISTATPEEEVETGNIHTFTSIDHLQQFQSYIIEQLGKTDLVLQELQEVVE